MPPLALSDDQLASVMASAEPLHPRDRAAYLQRVAELLDGHSVLGDGLVNRCARQAFAELFRAPAVEETAQLSRYR